MPRADVAFLNAIWKASPAILNTLLTLLNEKTFKNGDMIQQVPLKVLLSASNEVPEANQGLDALYDWFILRLMVKPIEQKQQQGTGFYAIAIAIANLRFEHLNQGLFDHQWIYKAKTGQVLSLDTDG